MKIVVIFPTQTEARLFSHPHAIVEIGGVGLSAAAYSTHKIILQHQPDWLIMAGIAGVYAHAGFGLGDVVLVQTEREADLGFFTPQGFAHLADIDLDMEFSINKEWRCPYLPDQTILPFAKSNSMNAAMAPFIHTAGIDIENMEGAAFFHVCLAEQQKFLQVRSISNVAKVGDDNWDIDASVGSLALGLQRLIDYVLIQGDEA